MQGYSVLTMSERGMQHECDFMTSLRFSRRLEGTRFTSRMTRMKAAVSLMDFSYMMLRRDHLAEEMRCGSNKVINAHDMRQDITGQKGETQEARRHQSLSHPVSTGTSVSMLIPC